MRKVIAENQILILPYKQRDCLPSIQSPSLPQSKVQVFSNPKSKSLLALLNLKKPRGKKRKRVPALFLAQTLNLSVRYLISLIIIDKPHFYFVSTSFLPFLARF